MLHEDCTCGKSLHCNEIHTPDSHECAQDSLPRLWIKDNKVINNFQFFAQPDCLANVSS